LKKLKKITDFDFGFSSFSVLSPNPILGSRDSTGQQQSRQVTAGAVLWVCVNYRLWDTIASLQQFESN
jgi:hypothetical protein